MSHRLTGSLCSGKDAASARYIYCALGEHTRAIFSAADEPLLCAAKQEDGEEAEPQHYLPIVPMLAINGSQGLGTVRGFFCSFRFVSCNVLLLLLLPLSLLLRFCCAFVLFWQIASSRAQSSPLSSAYRIASHRLSVCACVPICQRSHGRLRKGWSTAIPPHHPLHVLDAVGAALDGKLVAPLTPWFRGYG